jgi:hypothetical protein
MARSLSECYDNEPLTIGPDDRLTHVFRLTPTNEWKQCDFGSLLGGDIVHFRDSRSSLPVYNGLKYRVVRSWVPEGFSHRNFEVVVVGPLES